ncbi:MAG: hypothetical protein GYA20_01620 [Chloroflexi bacterium]|nr:hypothetical protein [Chloroflexota bacterium]
MIQIHKTTTQVLFIFHRPGARTAWVYDGQQFLRFVYLTATQEFRFVRRQAYLPAGLRGEPFVLNVLETRSLQREAREHGLHLRLFTNPHECILYALPVNLHQTVFDLFPPAGSITPAGINLRRNTPPWNRRDEAC